MSSPTRPLDKNKENQKKCFFCSQTVDPLDPNYSHKVMDLSKEDMEEIRKYITFCLDKHGIFISHDEPSTYANIETVLQVYDKMTRFLMK